MHRWTAREFLDAERLIAKWWRRSLTAIDFNAMVKTLMAEIGPHWRKPKTLQDARADDRYHHRPYGPGMAPRIRHRPARRVGREGAGCIGLGWKPSPAAPRMHALFHLHAVRSIIFFCLVLRTQLLRNVKPSHQIDLAYLYYLPFCSIFTSKDNFHAQIVPLFLTPEQSFINGIELKEDLKKLDERYSALDESEFKKGTTSFARHPPDDAAFLTTRLWDKHVPKWRDGLLP